MRFLSAGLLLLTCLLAPLAHAAGALDNTFDTGTGPNQMVSGMSLQPDGKVIIGGQFTSINGTARNRIARLNADGALDTGFNADGSLDSGFVAGGALDSSFASSFASTLQPDGKVIINTHDTGYMYPAKIGVARLNADGSLDSSFYAGDIINETYTDPSINAIVLQPDGKVVIGGAFLSVNGVARRHIARLNANGSLDAGFADPSLDTSFTNSSLFPAKVNAVAVQPDGRVWVGGADGLLARINTDGSLDSTFTRGGYPFFVAINSNFGIINSLVLQQDGKLLVGGMFDNLTGTSGVPDVGPVINLLRLNTDGSLDSSFSAGLGYYSEPYNAPDGGSIKSLALQPDGKILIVGNQLNNPADTACSNTNRCILLRLQANGALDTSFSPGSAIDDGSLDTGFGYDTQVILRTVALQPDGNVLIAGKFTQYNGTGVKAIARLRADDNKSSQVITVTIPAPAVAANGSYFSVAATASSQLPVSITVSGGCTVAGVVVTITSDVTPCVVMYDQAGNTNSEPAPQVTSTTTVNAGVAQNITVTSPVLANVPPGASFPVTATASSGLPVTIAVSSNCTLTAGVVTLSAGSAVCTVSFTQAGDAVYSAAPQISNVVTPVLVAPVQVSAGSEHTCVLDKTGVHCWGYNGSGQTTVPALVNPVQISAGSHHTCALDDTGVHCWGYNGYGQTTVPALSNPVQVSAGEYHSCALDNTGVHCWGNNVGGATTVPALSSPVQVSAGGYHTCALDNTGVRCWGRNSFGESTVPALVNPVQVSAGIYHTCALHNTGVRCWGANDSGQTIVPALVNPTQVSAGGYHSCALDNTGVHCWGSSSNGQTTVPALINPIQVSASGSHHTCALDDTGVHCWGDNSSGQAINFVAGKYSQAITVTTAAPASALVNSSFPVAAIASSGLPVAITVSGDCTLAAGIVTMTGNTTACTVNYNQAGNTVYAAAPALSAVVVEGITAQTISVTQAAPVAAANGSSFTVTATASSHLPVTVTTSGGCSNTGAVVTITSAVTPCVVMYDQPGDSNCCTAAPQVINTVAVNAGITQTITVTTTVPTATSYYASFPVAATSSSGLPVAIAVSGNCALAAGIVTMGGGVTDCTINYNQLGSIVYASAPQVTRVVSVKQTITVTQAAPAVAANGSYFSVAATASSGLPVTVTTSGGCSNVGAVVTVTSDTTPCVVMYDQAGNASWPAAPQVSSNTTVNAGVAQTITATLPTTANYHGSFPVTATSSSGLPVSIAVSGNCTLAAGIVTMSGGVTACTVTFNQAGDAVYAAAPQVTNVVTVIQQTITVTSPVLANVPFNSSFPVSATASSGLPVSITVSGNCTITNGVVTMSAGTTACTVMFNQAGNIDYPPASQVTTVAAPVFMNPAQISAGISDTCVLDSAGVHCWGDNYYGQTTVPVLTNPVQIAAGSRHACALDNTGVHCWGDNYSGKATPPTLINPTQVSAGGDHTCALDNLGVHCWGGNLDGATTVPVLVNPVQVSAGESHTCALDNTGVHCWGYNGFGQVTVPGLVNPVQVSAGWRHTCALDSTGVHCWGNNNYGQTVVPVLLNPTQVSAGGEHTCALDDTGVKCWGYNGYGQITVPPLVNPVQISAGRDYTCALDDTGVRCWGYNGYGQAVNVANAKYSQAITVTTAAPSNALLNSSFPVAATATSGLSVDITVSGDCTLAAGIVTITGSATVCTVNYNQAGNATYAAAPTVSAVVAEGIAAQNITVTLKAPSAAANGSYFSVAAIASSHLPVTISTSGGCSNTGTVVTITSDVTPCVVMYDQPGDSNCCTAAPQVSNTVAVNAGTAQTITVTTFPTLGVGVNGSFPVAATASSGLPVMISVSGNCSLAAGKVTMSGVTCTVYFNQAGNAYYAAAPQVTRVSSNVAQTITVTSPVLANVPLSSSFPVSATASSGLPVSITVSGNCTIASGVVTMSSGNTACTVMFNQAGNSDYLPAPQVTAVATPVLSGVIQVSAGGSHTCVLDSTGVRCWGDNGYGQTTVPVLLNPVQVSAGYNHTCALDNTGVHCWGYNGYGQTTVPVLVNPTQVSAGDGDTCALDNTGVHCWGYNNYGQTIVPALVNPTQVSAGGSHTCAIDSTGVHCWGDNGYGQTTVPALLNPTQISTGGSHTCALDNTGVRCWGWNYYGATTVPALVNPVQVSARMGHTCALDSTGVRCWGYSVFGQTTVPILTNPVQVSAGFYHTCALDNTGVRCWGDNDYGRANSFTTNKYSQVITVTTAAPSSSLLNSSFPVAATATSGLPVDITVSGDCTLAASIVTITGNTTACTVNYNQVGNATYSAAPTVSAMVTEGVAAQNITVTLKAPVAAANSSSFTVAAIASSHLPVTISTSGGCSNTGALVTITSAVTPCVVMYDQPGNSDCCTAAPQVTNTVAVNAGTAQTITVTAFPTLAVSSFPVAATVSSGLPVTITVSGNCSLAAGTVTMSGATCTVYFNQAGNAAYAAAPQIARTSNNFAQTITVTTPAPVNTPPSGIFPVAATASSGLPVTITVSGSCSISAGVVTMTSAASACVVTYTQSGNIIYSAAPVVSSNTVHVAQTITVTSPVLANVAFHSSFPVTAMASSGLAVAITVSGSCTVAAGVVTMTGALGSTCTTKFNQAGNVVYAAATQVSVTSTVASGQASQVSAGYLHTCSLDAAGVRCWGSNAFNQTTVPALTNPVQVSAGQYHTCALHSTGVKCWGFNGSGRTTVPALVNPAQVSAGKSHTCALDNTGVHCWGDNTYGQTTVPALVNPTYISAGGVHTCAVDNTGMHCWGYGGDGQLAVPALVNPVQVSAGSNHSCALDSTGVHCWGYNGYGQTTVPTLVNPTQVSAGGNHSCALDSTGVHCWGDSTSGQITVPTLINPIKVSAGGSHTCAVDDTGVRCWGLNTSGQAANSATSKYSQVITVTTAAPASAVRNSTFPVAAISTSGLPVAISTTGGCSIAAGDVTMTSDTVACTVNYNQAGNASYSAAPQVVSTTAALPLDTDSDGVPDANDNCLLISNADQLDSDGDAIGDVCDAFPFVLFDTDNDGITDSTDNCPLMSNADQLNMDADAFGDACDGDIDGDGIANAMDTNPSNASIATEIVLPLDGVHQGAGNKAAIEQR